LNFRETKVQVRVADAFAAQKQEQEHLLLRRKSIRNYVPGRAEQKGLRLGYNQSVRAVTLA